VSDAENCPAPNSEFCVTYAQRGHLWDIRLPRGDVLVNVIYGKFVIASEPKQSRENPGGRNQI